MKNKTKRPPHGSSVPARVETVVRELLLNLAWLKFDPLIVMAIDKKSGEAKDHGPIVRSRIKRDRAKLAKLRETYHVPARVLADLLNRLYPAVIPEVAVKCERRPGAFPKRCPLRVRHLLPGGPLPLRRAPSFRSYQAKTAVEVLIDCEMAGYLSTPIHQKESGLPYTAWALMKPVSKDHPALVVWTKSLPEDPWPRHRDGVLVEISKCPKVLFGGEIDPADFAQVAPFIRRNLDALLKHWTDCGTCDLVMALKPVRTTSKRDSTTK